MNIKFLRKMTEDFLLIKLNTLKKQGYFFTHKTKHAHFWLYENSYAYALIMADISHYQMQIKNLVSMCVSTQLIDIYLKLWCQTKIKDKNGRKTCFISLHSKTLDNLKGSPIWCCLTDIKKIKENFYYKQRSSVQIKVRRIQYWQGETKVKRRRHW